MISTFERTVDRTPSATALVVCGRAFSYAELDAIANGVAGALASHGIGVGARVAVLIDRSLSLYAGLLGALKTGAAIVPIDPGSPPERVAFIVDDAEVDLVLVADEAAHQNLRCPVLRLDDDELLDGATPARLHRRAAEPEELCYVMYTSGSTGRPKGVAVSQGSICNFLRVAANVYGIRPDDRVYQGMTAAFDFSIEEIWVPWAAGAAVVAGPTDHSRLGADLATFLSQNAVSVFCVVPTLLSTIDVDLPTVRLMLVGGEPCPADLVQRWARPGRRMLNTYGPTEATVTATVAELRPGRVVTIGRPMPTYSVEVLDADLEPVPAGCAGEICIGGPGLALGYLNRPEETAAAFVCPGPGRRLYRTGDIGRATEDGEIEYLGRLDSQVKVRGYRIDVAEIESVLLEEPEVLAAVVALVPGGGEDLAAYVTAKSSGGADALMERLEDRARQTLPAYMVPRSIDVLDSLPTTTSGKVDRNKLPPPRRVAPDSGYVAPLSPVETELADVWRSVLGGAPISVDADFFVDLGGHSLSAARVVSMLRQRESFAGMSIADLYAHSTVRRLARFVDTRPEPAATARWDSATAGTESPPTPGLRRAGAAQLILLYGVILALTAPVSWIIATRGAHPTAGLLAEGFAVFVVSTVVSAVALPVLGARLLVAGLGPGTYRLWGSHYLRWWLFNKLLVLSPLGVLSGSPLAAPYLRLLGARIGRGCYLGTSRFELPSLITIGDGASLGFGALVQPFEVVDGWFRIAPISIGAWSFVGANAVVLAGARLGANARLAEQSLLAADQVVADGAHVSGSPARPVRDSDAVLDDIERHATARTRWRMSCVVAVVAAFVMLELVPFVAVAPAAIALAWFTARFGLVGATVATFLAGPLYVLSTCGIVAAGHRVVLPRVKAGVFSTKSAVGVRKWFADKLFETSLALTNSLYGTLYTGPWLRALGARVGRRAEVSTVANIDPHLLDLGHETFVADLACVGGATYHRGHFALGVTTLGRRSFVGNAALVRGATELGGGSLVGVSTVVDRGVVPAGTTWLGSPAIAFPRREASESFAEELTYHPSRWRVAERLVFEYFRVTLPAVLLAAAGVGVVAAELAMVRRLPSWALILSAPLFVLGAGAAVVATVAAIKWLLVGRYRPRAAPLWSRFVRRTELVTGLYEAAAVPALLGWLTGTPFIGSALRLFGASVGRRVWCDTTFLTEFDLVAVGDGACIGALTSLQTHLFEDRVMKMATVEVGAGATVGARSVVLYDARVAAGARLDALSLVMKGESLPEDSSWQGIPAMSVA